MPQRSPPRRANASRVRPEVGPRDGGVPFARAPGSEAGALRPAQPRPFGSGQRRVLPLPHRSGAIRISSFTARCCRSSARVTTRRRRPAGPRRAHLDERARGDPDRVSGRRDLPGLAARVRALRPRLGKALRRRGHRRHPVRPVHPLRHGLRGLPAGAPPGRGLLRGQRARHRAGRPAAWRPRSTRGQDRRARGGHPTLGGQGRAQARRSERRSSGRGRGRRGRPKHNRAVAKGEKLIAENRKARHDYNLVERFEAGLVLTGSEVKSLREGRVSLQQAYADVRDGEAWLIGAHIDTYDQAGLENHDPVRDRKLLLKRREIESLYGKVRERPDARPDNLFKDGRAKVEVALGREGRARQAARHREARCGSSDRARAEGAVEIAATICRTNIRGRPGFDVVVRRAASRGPRSAS